MLTVAYLANEFPCTVESYISDEIAELRRRGVRVVASSVRKPAQPSNANGCMPTIVVQSSALVVLVRAAGLLLWRCKRIAPLLYRILIAGSEKPLQRAKALVHTYLGACYAVTLGATKVDHIHVHHGYFGSWIAMTAARLLDVGFSITLHGSDLLVHGTYLDLKLANCTFCLTISEYNREYILRQYPAVDSKKIVVSRLGVAVEEDAAIFDGKRRSCDTPLSLLAVGRLHAVKDHAFLVRACADLRERGMAFKCLIAGDGAERAKLEGLIQSSGLNDEVSLLGYVDRERLQLLYQQADVVVLTSKSEGIPLVLMEAMAHGAVVLAPEITGIPELVVTGETGFLYKPGSQHDFVAHLLYIDWLRQSASCTSVQGPSYSRHETADISLGQLDAMRGNARLHVLKNFNQSKNLKLFGEQFLAGISRNSEDTLNENFVLQQI